MVRKVIKRGWNRYIFLRGGRFDAPTSFRDINRKPGMMDAFVDGIRCWPCGVFVEEIITYGDMVGYGAQNLRPNRLPVSLHH